MHINELKQNYKLIDLFLNLVQIPSPSMSEEKVIEWIIDYADKNSFSAKCDDYKNVHIKINATDSSKKPMLLSAHMDVVGDFSPINPSIEGNFIQTDKKRTLGADDKVGVANSLMLATELASNPEIKHGGLEIIFTRDEEHGMSGIKHLDFSSIESKYALVLDADKLGQLLVSGASYTNGLLKVITNFGGHSGLDISDTNRLNAAKLISDLISTLPQGVFYKDGTGVITSINLGTIIAGDIQNTTSKVLSDKIVSENYVDFYMENSVTNVINTKAHASYSIRSASVEKENELKQIIWDKINKFNAIHEGLAHAEMIFSTHLPPFEKADDNYIEKIHTTACNKLKITQSISSFHAGAETHIYSQNSNFNGEKIVPFLVGLSDVFNMHSVDEKVDYTSMLKGYELLKEMFFEFNA